MADCRMVLAVYDGRPHSTLIRLARGDLPILFSLLLSFQAQGH